MSSDGLSSSRSSNTLYVCVKCRREGPMADFQDECRPGWTHDRLLPIETTAEDALRNDHYDQQLRKLAEVGSELCCYGPGAGDAEAWPKARCDCKFLDLNVVLLNVANLPRMVSEHTGCAEVRTAWRVVAALKEAANG